MNAKQYASSIAKDCNAWATMFDHCFICKQSYWNLMFATQTHEIIPKSALPRSYWHRCNALKVCAGCHGGVIPTLRNDTDKDGDQLGIARQLAIKIQPGNDVDNFCLETFNQMYRDSFGPNSLVEIFYWQIRDQLDWMQNNPEWWR